MIGMTPGQVNPAGHEYWFQQDNPGLELRIETSYSSSDQFTLSDCDLGVRFGTGSWPGLMAEKLMSLRVTPVCSPEFQRQHKMKTLADIRGKTLINLPPNNPLSFSKLSLLNCFTDTNNWN